MSLSSFICQLSIFNCQLIGQLTEWPHGADCNSAGFRLRWFESITAHTNETKERIGWFIRSCGSSSVDRALAFQAEGRGFEPRLPLFFLAVIAQW